MKEGYLTGLGLISWVLQDEGMAVIGLKCEGLGVPNVSLKWNICEGPRGC